MTVDPQDPVVSDQHRSVQDTVLGKMSDQHIRVAVVGDVDASKSTLIGTLVTGKLDDGRGSARSQMYKYKHELDTGRTSSISTHLLGLTADTFQSVTGSYQSVVVRSDRLVSLMDLAGHEKYMKTTVAGVARGMSDYALVLVKAGQPPTAMTVQHLKLCASMNIPEVILLTKTDRCPAHAFQATKQDLVRMLRAHGLDHQRPFMIKTAHDVEMVHNKMSSLMPIIPVSCTTGDGLDLVRMLLTMLPQRRRHAKKQLGKPFEYLVEEIFQVQGVGTVLSGFVTRGSWKKGQPIFIGPLKDGTVMQVVPKSVHVAQTLVDTVWAGHSVCFALPKLSQVRRKLLGKGMVATTTPFAPSRGFVADIYLTRGATVTVQSGKFDATLHVLHMKQSAKVVDIRVDSREQTVIRQGDTARVTLNFSHKTSYVRPGMRIILRSGPVIGYGVVKAPV